MINTTKFKVECVEYKKETKRKDFVVGEGLCTQVHMSSEKNQQVKNLSFHGIINVVKATESPSRIK